MKRVVVLLWMLVAVVAGRAAWYDSVAAVYTKYIGVREATGRNDGPEVEMFLGYVGFSAGAPWCAAFVSWCFHEAGVEAQRSAWSPAWFPAGRTVYRRGRARAYHMQRADVFGIYNSRLRRIAHVGFVDGEDGDWLITVEGNTNEAGAREGVGVLRKRRHKRAIERVSRWN